MAGLDDSVASVVAAGCVTAEGAALCASAIEADTNAATIARLIEQRRVVITPGYNAKPIPRLAPRRAFRYAACVLSGEHPLTDGLSNVAAGNPADRAPVKRFW